MAAPPDDQFLDFLSAPALMVNRFRIKNHSGNDHYLYVPGNSFRLQGEHALENVDIDPRRYPFNPQDIENLTYVPQGPAFLAWPANQRSVLTSEGGMPLTEYRSVHDSANSTVRYSGRRINMATSDAPPPMQLPGFSLPTEYSEALRVSQVYELTAKDKAGNQKYLYSFDPKARNGWSQGTPVFWAMRPEEVGAALGATAREAQQNQRKPAGLDELSSPATVRELAELSKGMFAPGKAIDERNHANLVSALEGKGLPVKAFTTGASGDASIVVGGMVERGLVWNLQKKPIHQYTTFGFGVSVAVGATVNFTLGFWWGESEAKVLELMQGLSSYVVFGGTVGVGLNIYLSMTLEGLVYGLTLSPQFGPEVEIGLGYGGTYTSFYEPPPEYYRTMKMPTGVWG